MNFKMDAVLFSQVVGSNAGFDSFSNSATVFNSIASNNQNIGFNGGTSTVAFANLTSFSNGTYGVKENKLSNTTHHQLLAVDNTTGFILSGSGGTLNVGTLPNPSLQTRCSSGTCGIYDLKIKAGSHCLKNFNGTFVAAVVCPSSTKGSNSIVYMYNGSPVTGLKTAAEFLLDGYGNDNNICEANELCNFPPDVGANIFDNLHI